jgi:hypothetical protein
VPGRSARYGSFVGTLLQARGVMSDSTATPQRGELASNFKQQRQMADISESGSGGHGRPAGLWPNVLDAARTEQDLVKIVREYVATWSPEELGRLPAPCRPGKITDGEDVSDFAFCLARAHLSFSGALADRLLMERLMGFFTHASARLAALQASASHS